MEQTEAHKLISFTFLFLTIMVFLYIELKQKREDNIVPTFSQSFTRILLFFTILLITFFPIGINTDKSRYEQMFNDPLYLLLSNNDLGWTLYNYLIRAIFNNVFIFFLITASIYVIGYYFFALKFISKKYLFVYLLACFGTFGFISYGVNTIRAGFGLSLLLIAFVNNKKKFVFIFLAILSILMHKSMLIPIIAYILTYFFKDSRLYLIFWIVMLLISFANISLIADFIQNNLGGVDQRVDGYFNPKESVSYNTGFRVEFVIYSLIPIILGFLYIKKMRIKDYIYIRFFNMYLFTNSVWLAIMRIIYSDRIAYLSWFLIPIILLLPLFRQKIFINQRLYIGFILLGLVFFNFIMFL